MASLPPYQDILGRKKAVHLLWRLTFGATKQETDTFAQYTPQLAVEKLLQRPTIAFPPPKDPATGQSWGTDHSTVAPMFISGNHVKPGITGNNPDLYDLDRNNLRMQHDYRQVFGAIVQGWFEASPEAMQIDLPQKPTSLGKPAPYRVGLAHAHTGPRFLFSSGLCQPASLWPPSDTISRLCNDTGQGQH